MNKKILVIIFSFLFLPFFVSTASAVTTLSLSPTSVSVKAGQTFKLNVYANPNGVSNYTIKTNITFPADLVEVQTWNYGGDWMPLRQSGYDYFSNAEGVIIRTAGYTGGFSSSKVFGNITFLAKKSGTAVIQITSESLALDENSENVFGGGGHATVTIATKIVEPTKTPAVDTTIKPTTTLPEETLVTPTSSESTIQNLNQLSDISLTFADPNLRNDADLLVNVWFKSILTESLPMDITFSIRNKNGEEVYKTFDSVVVENELDYHKQFNYLRLPPGKYTIVLTTFYNGSARDEVEQNFTVGRSLISFWPYVVVPLLILLIIFLGLNIKWIVKMTKKCHTSIFKKRK